MQPGDTGSTDFSLFGLVMSHTEAKTRQELIDLKLLDFSCNASLSAKDELLMALILTQKIELVSIRKLRMARVLFPIRKRAIRAKSAVVEIQRCLIAGT